MSQPIEILLYTRPGCHLCEEAESLLAQCGKGLALNIIKIDIDIQPSLVERYGEKIPVLLINGKERFFGKVQPPLLQRALTTEARKPAKNAKPR
jgi:glutaredoxin